MAIEFPGQVISLASSGDLSAKQYHLVVLGTAAYSAKLATAATNKVVGVLQNTPSTGGGDAASVMLSGVTKVVKNSTTVAAISVGDSLVCTTAGGVQTKTAGTLAQYIIGEAWIGMSSGTTGYISMLITHEGRGSSVA